MKAIKIIFIASLVTLGASLLGQPAHVDYIKVSQADNSNRVENYINALLSMADLKENQVHFRPSVQMSFTLDQPEVVYEKVYHTESWMIRPFAAAENIEVESWMTAPFKIGVIEPDLVIESWMTAPFDIDENIEIEEWMTSTF